MKLGVLGFDPGLSGGVAALVEGEPVEWSAVEVAAGEIDAAWLADWVRGLCHPPVHFTAVVEKVHSMPKQGVSSTFKFGTTYGTIRGVLTGLSVGYELVTPQKWKGDVLRGTDRDKAAAIAYCRRRWPEVSLLATERSRKPHDGIADALCIAEYGWRLRTGSR